MIIHYENEEQKEKIMEKIEWEIMKIRVCLQFIDKKSIDRSINLLMHRAQR